MQTCLNRLMEKNGKLAAIFDVFIHLSTCPVESRHTVIVCKCG